MAKPPPIKSLLMEHLTNDAGEFDQERLVQALNQFMGSVHGALSSGLTLGENLAASIKNVRLEVPPESSFWTEIGSPGAPAFQSGCSNFGGGWDTAGFLIGSDGCVDVKGLVNVPTGSNPVFTLPVGYRPRQGIHVASIVGGAFAYINIGPGGDLYAITSTAGWLTVHCRFRAHNPAPPKPFTGSTWPVKVKHGLPKCTKATVLSCRLKNAGQDVVGPFHLDWEDLGNGQIKVKSAYGLTPGQTYDLTLLMLSE